MEVLLHALELVGGRALHHALLTAPPALFNAKKGQHSLSLFVCFSAVYSISVTYSRPCSTRNLISWSAKRMP